jgi:hypothetical protein
MSESEKLLDERIRKVAVKVTHEILESEVWPIIVDAANAEESKAVNLKQQVKTIIDSRQPKPKTDSPADTEEILWTAQTGQKGEYEKTEDRDNPSFQALLKTLQSHEGKMQADGWFLWIFPDGQTIGRKRKV